LPVLGRPSDGRPILRFHRGERVSDKEDRFMAQEQVVLHRIDWQSTFAFTRLFGGFRSALHSTKILLALAGLFLTFVLGGVLDLLWVHAGQGVWPGEIAAYAQAGGRPGYDLAAAQTRYDTLADLLVNLGLAKRDEAQKEARANPSSSANRIEEKIVQQYRERRYSVTTPEARAALLREMQTRLAELKEARPVGPFRVYVSHQMGALRNAVFAAAQLRFADGLSAALHGQAAAPATAVRLPGEPLPIAQQPGVLASLVMLWFGLVWLFKGHWFYSLLFTPLALAIWALAGGAISRAAVMQFAKDERIGLRQALRFSFSKFWGFFFAPIVSLLFIVVFGLLLTLGGLIGSIPFFGDIIVGLLWFLALLGGLAIAFITIGLLAGGNLFAPVISAEGSDAFDAISRGFVYVYSRPWKSILYALTLMVYGSLCYLFLRFFVWLMLASVHAFVGAGMFRARPEAGFGLHKLDVVWQAPTFVNLRPHAFDWQLLGLGEVLLFVLICVWTYIVWGLLQSWLIAFYFTGSSMAYLLLRRDVDAIDLEEIYTEEQPEAEAVPQAAAPGTTAEAGAAAAAPGGAPSSPAAPASPAGPPPESPPAQPGPPPA
jgi:hypothetical protein